MTHDELKRKMYLAGRAAAFGGSQTLTEAFLRVMEDLNEIPGDVLQSFLAGAVAENGPMVAAALLRIEQLADLKQLSLDSEPEWN